MTTTKIVAIESCGPEVQQTYVKFDNGDQIFVAKRVQKKWSSIRNVLYDVFLPAGFPESVSGDYIEYQIWDSIQAFASAITGTLATQAVFTGVGVGDQTASVLAATTTWILKDGMGMVGRIVFAWCQGSNLDYDSKKWRLFADVLNDSAIILEMSSQYFKNYITPILCISSVAKSIVGVAGGATRAALTQHQARNNNMADVSAKDGSQETLVNLAAFLCSLLLLRFLLLNQLLMYTIFVTFTALHIVSNYKAVSCLVMETFNRARFKIVVKRFLEGNGGTMSVADINAAEPVWFSCSSRKVNIRLGAPVSSVGLSYRELCRRTESLAYDDRARYLVKLSKHEKKGVLSINVVLHEQCTVRDQMEAMFHSFLLEFVLLGNLAVNAGAPWFSGVRTLEDLAQNPVLHEQQLVALSRAVAKEQFKELWKGIAGSEWRTDYVLFGASEWRAVWNVKGISRPEHSHLSLATE
ncbi:RUS family member 1-like [Ornithodoros turicata]|uniref:RUS family member 1-like n=1 Tax=Ornithodoros turicata TaxID=34597 RepID=UPI0031399996